VDSTSFRKIVGSLRYLCNSRPDIFYSVSVISKFMHDPRKPHLIVAKRILRYVKGTLEYGFLFSYGSKSKTNELIGYSYSDWCGDFTAIRGTSRYVFMSMMLLYLGIPRRNPLMQTHPVKLSTLQVHLLHVKRCGWIQ